MAEQHKDTCGGEENNTCFSKCVSITLCSNYPKSGVSNMQPRGHLWPHTLIFCGCQLQFLPIQVQAQVVDSNGDFLFLNRGQGFTQCKTGGLPDFTCVPPQA